MQKHTLNTPRCPSCDSSNVRPSARAFVDRVYALFGQNPFRCRNCRARFRKHLATPSYAPNRSKRRSKRVEINKQELYVYATVSLAFAAAVLLLTQA